MLLVKHTPNLKKIKKKDPKEIFKPTRLMIKNIIYMASQAISQKIVG